MLSCIILTSQKTSTMSDDVKAALNDEKVVNYVSVMAFFLDSGEASF